ncbi:unnamed protein product [Cyclocybe aegerita]|uniref:protein-tyrosine-phosphatase n=1 Tax=Cyclocybe aegerita TaxID=1973307 RepID=A0A8S0X479_CYCAE|nr:unnamed protein product [Cyclocybe aegerita]
MDPAVQTAGLSGQRRRGVPANLRIQPPAHVQQIAIALADSDPSTLSSADSDYPPFKPSDRSARKNMKKLSLDLPSAQSSSASLLDHPAAPSPVPSERPRRPSIASLPTINATASLFHRKDEDGGSPTAPYADGPVQIIPGIWIGSEDNARDWKGLIERGIRSILNVAKEVASPFDTAAAASQSLRPVVSTPNFRDRKHPHSTYYPAHVPSGRPAMHYLKLQWSHGQQDLVKDGFKAGMSFADAALERGEGCLIHCQCGISRSATMVIALVMRAAAEHHTSVPPEVWELKGMQGAYSFVKEKSPCVGPNMSLIYQLLEYEKLLRGDKGSPNDSDGSSGTDEEEEWGRRRRMMEEASDNEPDEQESSLVMQEAHALDKAMEDRIVARKSSASSMSSLGSGSGLGMGHAWRSRYSRKRTGSIASNKTNGSFLSEDLVEEDEEQELLGVGGNSDNDSRQEALSLTSSPDDEEHDGTPRNVLVMTPSLATARPPPSAPVWKTSFTVSPPPMTAVRSTFDIPPRPPAIKPLAAKPPAIIKPKPMKRKPMGLSILPPVPSSPVNLVIESDESAEPAPVEPRTGPKVALPLLPVRQRSDSRKLAPPPKQLRHSLLRTGSMSSTESVSVVSTPSQTLFVFPPSPTLTTRTPSTMTLTTNGPVPFPSLSTPRVSTFRSKGRTRSFIGLGAPPTPTVAFSKVDVRGYVGLE